MELLVGNRGDRCQRAQTDQQQPVTGFKDVDCTPLHAGPVYVLVSNNDDDIWRPRSIGQ